MVHVLDTIPEAYNIPVRLDKIHQCTECTDHDHFHDAYADAVLAIITAADEHYFRSPVEVVAACPLTDCYHHYLIRYFDSCPANSLPIVPFFFLFFFLIIYIRSTWTVVETQEWSHTHTQKSSGQRPANTRINTMVGRRNDHDAVDATVKDTHFFLLFRCNFMIFFRDK